MLYMYMYIQFFFLVRLYKQNHEDSVSLVPRVASSKMNGSRNKKVVRLQNCSLGPDQKLEPNFKFEPVF